MIVEIEIFNYMPALITYGGFTLMIFLLLHWILNSFHVVSENLFSFDTGLLNLDF